VTPTSRLLRGTIALVVATAGFSLAMALRGRVDPWRSTASAGAVGIALSAWALGPRHRTLAAITARGAIAAIALGALLVAATHAAFHLAAWVSPGLVGSVGALYASIDVGASPVTLVLLTTAVVLGEELVWRGVAIELAAAGRSRAAAGAIGTALYVFPQVLGGEPLLMILAAVVGALFTTQRLVTGRLADPFLTHAIWSVAVFVLVPLV
jgi:membrane protease YdiL (CAAX protease family)